jgi:subtilase family serine protease
MGSSLEQTPLPAEPETAAPAPASHASQTDASEAPDTTGDDSSDDAAPISGTHAPSAAPSQKSSAAPSGVRYACRQPAAADRRACDAIVQAPAPQRNAGGCNRSVPYCASDLQAAYGLSQAARDGGKGVVVGIVDAYGYAAAATDLTAYRKQMGLPGCAISNGCLRIVNQRGRANPLPKSNAATGDDWQAEEALDLDIVSAICPNCRIVLVQANSDKSADLAASVTAAGGLGAVAIVNAYGGKEKGASDAAYRRSGRAIVASAGSGGAGLRAPCSYAAVICVGGTSLAPTSSARGWSERIWRDAASGCSAIVAKPSWQRGSRCKTRAIPDLSAVADPATGVAVYESPGGWQQMGGTGIGSAIVAALFALGPPAARTNAPEWIWRHGAYGSYRRVGDAKSGYDGAAGWGTPNGTGGF